MNLKEIFDKSRELWNLDSQILMLGEECSELAVECHHMLRSTKAKEETLDKFAEEIADVQFMIDAMLYYFKLVPRVAKHRKLKEERLIKKLERGYT